MNYRVVRGCETREEAIARCGLRVGQPARISGFTASGNIHGEWVVLPEFEVTGEAAETAKEGSNAN